jgi:hypothetical protein
VPDADGAAFGAIILPQVSASEPQDAAVRGALEQLRRAGHLLREARTRLGRRALRLLGFLVFAYLVMKLIPGLENALKSLQGVSARWLAGAQVAAG